MINEIYKGKLERFVKDDAMVEAVFSEIRESFLKSKGQRSVDIMASERMAVDLLIEAKKDILKLRTESGEKSPAIKQVGL